MNKLGVWKYPWAKIPSTIYMQYVVENKTKNGMNFTLCFQRHIYIVYVFIWGQVHLSVMSKERGAFNPKDTARVKKIKLDLSFILWLLLFSITSWQSLRNFNVIYSMTWNNLVMVLRILRVIFISYLLKLKLLCFLLNCYGYAFLL